MGSKNYAILDSRESVAFYGFNTANSFLKRTCTLPPSTDTHLTAKFGLSRHGKHGFSIILIMMVFVVLVRPFLQNH